MIVIVCAEVLNFKRMIWCLVGFGCFIVIVIFMEEYSMSRIMAVEDRGIG